jgi:hypothetical protein
MKKLLALAFALLTSSAFAQDGPNHSMPVFGGAGFSGFRAVGPCSAGQALTWASSAVDPACQGVLTGTFPVTVPNGGTGVGTLTNHGVVLGQGTANVAVSSAGTAGQVFTSNGAAADPTFQSVSANTVSTMVALRALAPGASNTVYLTGYFTSTDGGEGLFVWDGASTVTDDAGTFIQPNAGGTGRWVRQLWNTSPNVGWFGAKCDTVMYQTNVSITSGTAAMTVSAGTFTSADIGKLIAVPGAAAAGATLHTSISAVGSTTSITLGNNAGSTLSASSRTLRYGTSDATAINAAVSWSVTQNGRKILFPPRVCTVASPISVSTNNMILEGTTGPEAMIRDTGINNQSSGLNWVNASGTTVVSVFSTGTGQQTRGVQVRNLAIYCNLAAGSEGLRINSISFGVFENLDMLDCMTGLNVNAQINTLAEAAGTCRNLFRNIGVMNRITSGISNVLITGNSTWNSCLNNFERMYVVHTGTANGIVCGDADNNTFVGIDTLGAAGSTGFGLLLTDNGAPSGSLGTCRQNTFIGLSTGIVSATQSMISSTANAKLNVIYDYDQHNNPSLPTVAAGSELRFTNNKYTFLSKLGTPTISACGTSPTTSSGSSNSSGRIITGTGATTCTITFTHAYSATPFCVVTQAGGGSINYSASTTAITVTSAVATSNIDYICTDQTP